MDLKWRQLKLRAFCICFGNVKRTLCLYGKKNKFCIQVIPRDDIRTSHLGVRPYREAAGSDNEQLNVDMQKTVFVGGASCELSLKFAVGSVLPPLSTPR